MIDYEPRLTDTDRRIVLVGAPMTGKSTLARQLGRRTGFPVLCGDPRSAARGTDWVTFLPEVVGWADAGAFVARHWLSRPGPWIAEGQVMARALRHCLDHGGVVPVDCVLVLRGQLVEYASDGQRSLAKGVMRVWDEIAPRLQGIVQELHLPPDEQGPCVELAVVEALGRLARGGA